MSEIKVNSIKGVGASTAAITVNNSDGTCTANITNNLSNRNLIINGAMQVAQRGTSSTSSGYQTLDRFPVFLNGCDENPTIEQADVASGTTPYTLGFRKSLKITNGNQTSSIGGNDYIWIQTKLEAQNIAQSGWNYLSSTNFITLSFWVKSSVAQTFKGYLETPDGSSQMYPFETGSLTADTWTKITKTIPGNSNLTFNNDNGEGLKFSIAPFIGTDKTSNSTTEDVWAAYSGSARMKDSTTTWFTTNDATFELTGVQLEVGSVATDFEHRSFGQEMFLCERYCQAVLDGTDANNSGQTDLAGLSYTSNNVFMVPQARTKMRAAPSIFTKTGAFYYRVFFDGSAVYFDSLALDRSSPNSATITVTTPSGGSIAAGMPCFVRTNNANAKILLIAEL